MRVTAHNLVRAIGQLPRGRQYEYVSPRNRGRIVVDHAQEPDGPIAFRRFNPSQGKSLAAAEVEHMSRPMLWRMANSIWPGEPINVDRVFGGSYNARSVLEALLAHTPDFYHCLPGRIELINDAARVKRGHKHLIYLPDEPHENGVLCEYSAPREMAISELPPSHVVYRDLKLGDEPGPSNGSVGMQTPPDMTFEQKRRHAQMQIALVLIGQQLGLRTWVAANDRNIEYSGRKLAEMPGVVNNLRSENVLTAYPAAADAGRLIDCIWFKNDRFIPAVMEIEHSTGVTSGLARMKRFHDAAPPLRDIDWTIVAPDEVHHLVCQKANQPQYRAMNVKFLPYSAVEELFSLCTRRRPEGLSERLTSCFMDQCVS